MLGLLLTKSGYQTRVAFGGEAGLRMGEDFHPDAVIMDLKMGGMDGHETCSRMRQLPWGAQARIFAHTGSPKRTEYEQAQAAGFDGYLLKPVSSADVKVLLESRTTFNWAQQPEGLERG